MSNFEIVSLGSNCSIAYQLKNMNYRNNSYPFDWATTSIKSLINSIENDFKNYTNLYIKKLSTNHLSFDNNVPSYIVSNIYNINMAHELINKDNIEYMSKCLERRIIRFKNLINPIFVRIETANLSNIQYQLYNKLMELLDKLYTNYRFILISKIKPQNNKIIWYYLESFDSDWKYPNIRWNEIFTTI